MCGQSHNRKNVNMPSLNGAVVLVTGANGGIGTHFVHQALARGAAKVYATARTPRTWDDERIIPLTLDITDAASIAAAVAAAPDVTALINDARALPPSASLLEVTEADIRANMETTSSGPSSWPVCSRREYEVIADELTAQVKVALSGPVEALYPELRDASHLVAVEE
jgi:NAD(P)-dependent dehydrogenase (short-subunit alcohol dehydrogenase family)